MKNLTPLYMVCTTFNIGVPIRVLSNGMGTRRQALLDPGITGHCWALNTMKPAPPIHYQSHSGQWWKHALLLPPRMTPMVSGKCHIHGKLHHLQYLLSQCSLCYATVGTDFQIRPSCCMTTESKRKSGWGEFGRHPLVQYSYNVLGWFFFHHLITPFKAQFTANDFKKPNLNKSLIVVFIDIIYHSALPTNSGFLSYRIQE